MQGPTLVSAPAADTQARPLPPSGRLLIDERLQDFHQRSLLIGREPGQRKRSPRHPPQQLRPDPRTGWRELEHFHAAVAGRDLAPDQAASLEPVDQSRDVRRVAGQRVGEPAHRQRPVGVEAEVSERVRLAGRGLAVSLMPLHRATLGGAAADQDGVLRVDFEARPDQAPAAALTRELEREYRAVVDEILELRGDDGRIRAFVRSITDSGALADTAGYSPDLNYAQKLQLLETFDVVERLQPALQLQRERLAELQVPKRIRDDVDDGAQKQQREYFLRRQMDAIRKELGENDGSVADEYRQKISSAGMPGPVRQQADREVARLERMGDTNAESAMIRTYLD